MDEFALWSGSPKHAFDDRDLMGKALNVMGPTYRPRMWKERPEWFNEASRLSQVDPEAADRGWDPLQNVHVRVFLTRGVHTVKVLDDIDGGPAEDGEHTHTGWQDADGSRYTTCWVARGGLRREGPAGPFGYVQGPRHLTYFPGHADIFNFTFRMSDDGYFELQFFGNHTGQELSWSNVCGLFNNVWPFTTTAEVDAVKGVGWWDTEYR